MGHSVLNPSTMNTLCTLLVLAVGSAQAAGGFRRVFDDHREYEGEVDRNLLYDRPVDAEFVRAQVVPGRVSHRPRLVKKVFVDKVKPIGRRPVKSRVVYDDDNGYDHGIDFEYDSYDGGNFVEVAPVGFGDYGSHRVVDTGRHGFGHGGHGRFGHGGHGRFGHDGHRRFGHDSQRRFGHAGYRRFGHGGARVVESVPVRRVVHGGSRRFVDHARSGGC